MSNDEDLCSGQLLRDIEEISQALYLNKAPSKGVFSQSKLQFSSDGEAVMRDVSHNNKKISLWSWKPLKALTHILSHRFNCFFFLRVHSVEGLATNFNDLILRVNWKRKDEVFRTRPVQVFQGIAEFEETLMHQCSVYVSRNGPQNSVKYEPKLFLLQASVNGAPTLDMGKHWVDLARLLPLTLEELEEEKRTSGKWTTSFKLKGKAKGAVLNVSFGFSILGDNPFDPSHFVKVSDIGGVSGQTTICPPAETAQIQRGSTLNRLGSVARKSSIECHHVSSQSLDMKFLHEVSADPKSELARSITFLYQKLDEGKFASLNESSILHEHILPRDTNSASFTDLAGGDPEKVVENSDFIVIEKGIELPEKDELVNERVQTVQNPASEAVDPAEVFPGNLKSFSGNEEPDLEHILDCDNLSRSVWDCIYEETNEHGMEPNEEEPQTVSCKLLASESPDLNSSPNISEFVAQENDVKSKPNIGSGKMVRSLSMDDVTETMANEFLDMMGIDHDARGISSDSEPESPRELLLKQFEKECSAFGDPSLYFNEAAERVEVGVVPRSGSGRVACSDDFDLSLAIQEAEKEHNRVTQSLRSRRNAKMLENLETETLMREWGLNEKFFQNSPRSTSGGFGSPIFVHREEPSELPPLEEGLGPIIETIGGGFLRSMNSSLFIRSRNCARLVMQVSNPVVLPSMMGSSVMDILQCWASGGTENMFVEANEVMPLPDITGKTMQQVGRETESDAKKLKRLDKWGNPSLQNAPSLSSGCISESQYSDYVSLEDLVPLALANIEALSIEGLRIQSGLSSEEAPSSIRPQLVRNFIPKVEKVKLNGLSGSSAATMLQPFEGEIKYDLNELMRLSVSLDEWIRLDTLDVDYEGEVDGHMLKVISAHRSKFFDSGGERVTMSGAKCGLFGNNFTLALRLQLRDPFRDNEMVGEPMLALAQVERVSIPRQQETLNGETEANSGNKRDGLDEALVTAETSFRGNYTKMNSQVIPLFKISEVHIAGFNAESNDRRLVKTGKPRQSGSRWLLSSGMHRASMRPFSNSYAVVKPSSRLLGKRPGDILWSISSHGHTSKWKELAELNFHVRNPDILLSSEPARSLKA